MSASKHTPGPWVHVTDGHPHPDVRAAAGRAVAITWMVCSSNPKTAAGYQARAEEDRANARLIAAAPELLQALREIADDYADRFDMASPSTNPGMKYVVSQALAAIAKAEGK